MKLQDVLPEDIERRSMEIITEELGDRVLDPENEAVIKRVIHTTADFEYADRLVFSPGAVRRGVDALCRGASIVTDTEMARAGINKRVLGRLGGTAYCFVADSGVAEEAKRNGTTRSAAAMQKAARELSGGPLIVAIGNAPTALLELENLLDAGAIHPDLVIGVPVGFVNAEESKERFLSRRDVPYIIARGRKGGSNVAAAICNALLYQSGSRTAP